MNDSKLVDNTSSVNSEDYIDLRNIFRLIYRNKKSFSIITSLFTLISIIYALSLEPVWRGKFQIVLSQDSSPSQSKGFLPVNILSGLNDKYGVNTDLKTQVEILKSNYVSEGFHKQPRRYRGDLSFCHGPDPRNESRTRTF